LPDIPVCDAAVVYFFAQALVRAILIVSNPIA
jgi:hypothetical protein